MKILLFVSLFTLIVFSSVSISLTNYRQSKQDNQITSSKEVSIFYQGKCVQKLPFQEYKQQNSCVKHFKDIRDSVIYSRILVDVPKDGGSIFYIKWLDEKGKVIQQMKLQLNGAVILSEEMFRKILRKTPRRKRNRVYLI